MEEAARPKETTVVKRFASGSKFSTLLVVVVIAVLLGSASGFFLASKSTSKIAVPIADKNAPKTAATDESRCRDFADGTIVAKDTKKVDYSEGTHTLQREKAQPVALTSSVVDLSEYENKNVKVFGETQKALKEGWLMDVCRVEAI